jgi:hypothetical protein
MTFLKSRKSSPSKGCYRLSKVSCFKELLPMQKAESLHYLSKFKVLIFWNITAIIMPLPKLLNAIDQVFCGKSASEFNNCTFVGIS